MQQHVAEAATASGDSVIFGAPNVVRGGSHIGSPSAEEMIKKGYCQIIGLRLLLPITACCNREADKQRCWLHRNSLASGQYRTGTGSPPD